MDVNLLKGQQSDDVIADTYERAQTNTLTAGIVAAYVSNNHITTDDLPDLIRKVRDTLAETAAVAEPEPAQVKASPSDIRKSITPDALISFEDGKKYKTLRRHLKLRGLTPESYRAKWGLPADYPSTAPNYSAQRSELAKTLGLGQQRRKAAAKTAGPDATVASDPVDKPKRKKIGIAA